MHTCITHPGPAEAANRPAKTLKSSSRPPAPIPFYLLNNKYLCPVMKRVVCVFKSFSQHSTLHLSLGFIYLNVSLRSKSVVNHMEQKAAVALIWRPRSVSYYIHVVSPPSWDGLPLTPGIRVRLKPHE